MTDAKGIAEKTDRRMFYALMAALVPLSMFLAFGAGTVEDEDYGLLLKGGMVLESAKSANIALFVLLPLAVYIICAYLLKVDAFCSFAAALLFGLSGANAEALYSFSPLLGTFLGKQYEIVNALKGIGAVLPLGTIALFGYRKDIAGAAIAALGLIALPFAPGIGGVLLALAAAKGIGLMESAPYGDKALVFVVFISAFQWAYTGESSAALAAAVLMAIIAYVVVSVHRMNPGEAYAFVFLLVAFSAINSLYSVEYAKALAVSPSEIAAFSSAKTIEGSFGVLGSRNAFVYYSGKNAELLNASALVKKSAAPQLPEYMIISTRTLDDAYSGKPVFFSYRGTAKGNNREYAVFANERYSLYLQMSGRELAAEDAELFDWRTGESLRFPFTKIRPLFSTSFNDTYSRMVNVQEIEGSGLFQLLFKSSAVFGQNGTIIVKTASNTTVN